jgi:hypothetical protein
VEVPTPAPSGAGGDKQKTPNVLPEGRYLFQIDNYTLVDDPQDKFAGRSSKLYVTTISPKDFAGRTVVCRIFHGSDPEKALKAALKVDEVTAQVKGQLVYGYTVNKPRKDGQGMYTILSDFKAVQIAEG